MATSLFKSFIEAINPGAGQPAKRTSDPQGCKFNRKTWCQTAWSAPELDPVLKSTLEVQATNIVQSDDVDQDAMQGWVEEGENALEVSREEVPSLELAEQIAVCRPVPVTELSLSPVNISLSSSLPASTQQPSHEVEDIGEEHGDIIQDAQLFQDTAMEYQAAYHSLEDRYTHQAILMKEASEALQALERQASTMQQELLALKLNCKADIQRVVSNTFSQYQQQLSSAQSCTSIINQLLCSCKTKSACSSCR